MAFGSTLTIAINGSNKVLNRINQDNYGSEYFLRGATDEYTVKIRHSQEATVAGKTRMDRHYISVTHVTFEVPGVSAEVVRELYTIVRAPYNDNLTTYGYLFAGFVDYLDSATVQGDLLTWQN